MPHGVGKAETSTSPSADPNLLGLNNNQDVQQLEKLVIFVANPLTEIEDGNEVISKESVSVEEEVAIIKALTKVSLPITKGVMEVVVLHATKENLGYLSNKTVTRTHIICHGDEE